MVQICTSLNELLLLLLRLLLNNLGSIRISEWNSVLNNWLLNKSRLLNILRLSYEWRLLNILNLLNWWVDNWCSNCWVSNDLRSLNWLIINVLFNSLLWDIFNFSLVSVLWNVFCDMFNLLIISVSLLYGLIGNLIYGLVFSHGLDNWYIFSFLLRYVFGILSLIWNLLLDGNWFIISVGLLYWDILNIRGCLWLRLSIYNSWLDIRLLNNLWLDIRWLNNWLEQWLSELLLGNNVASLWGSVNWSVLWALYLKWSWLNELRWQRLHFSNDFINLANWLLYDDMNFLERKKILFK